MRIRPLSPWLLAAAILVAARPAGADPPTVFEASFDGATCLEWSDAVPFCETPGVGLRFVLTWITPADPDETDDVGTDLDLHVLHPDAAGDWEGSWDCWSANPLPDWGSAGPSNDGVLVLADADGGGPEVVQVTDPEPGTYDFGVHYASDQGFGPSITTVDLYVDGAIAYQYSAKVLSGGQFWTVGWVSWPSGSVTVVDIVADGVP